MKRVAQYKHRNSTVTTNVEINVDQWYGNKEVWYDDFGQRYEEGPTHNINAHSFDVEHPEAIQKAIDNKSLRKLKPVSPKEEPAKTTPAKTTTTRKS